MSLMSFQIIAFMSMLVANAASAQEAPADIPRCGPVRGSMISSDTVHLPEPGGVAEVEIGQGMVSAYRHQLYDNGLTLLAPMTFRGRYMFVNFDVSFPANGFSPVSVDNRLYYHTPNYTFKFASESRPRTFGRADVYLAPDPENPAGLTALVSHGGVKQRYSIPSADYRTGRCWDLAADSFRRELIYGGVSQGTISIEYREFINDIARPAFSQTLRYDLNDGREIGFRGARFEIIEANNVSVKYRVIRPLQ